MDIRDYLKGDLTDYQSIPFWSWNDELKPEELRRQIRLMKEAGIGGFFMHARGGLTTPYLGEDWMQDTAACIDEARKLNMDAWSDTADVVETQFACQYHLFATDLLKELHFIEGSVVALGRGMQGDWREVEFEDAHVLDNQRIHTDLVELFDEQFGFG